MAHYKGGYEQNILNMSTHWFRSAEYPATVACMPTCKHTHTPAHTHTHTHAYMDNNAVQKKKKKGTKQVLNYSDPLLCLKAK